MYETPFFSIVTVSLNAGETIIKTINSVLEQDFDDYEIIVKDGFSTDNTIANIPKSEHIKVYQSQDTNVYEAMNQGISYSKGKYICFLNCGDVFADNDVLSKVYKNCCEYSGDIVYGNYSRKGVKFKQPSSLTKFYLYKTTINHQSMFFSRALFEKKGVYDTDYKIFADYEYTLRCFFEGVKFEYCDCIIADYLGGGISEVRGQGEERKKEHNKIRSIYFNKKESKKYEFILGSTMRKMRQKIISDNSPKILRTYYRKIVNLINR